MIPFSDGRTSVGHVTTAEHWDRLPGDEEARLRSRLSSDLNVANRLLHAEQVSAVQVAHSYGAATSRLVGERYAIVGHSGRFIDPVLSSGVALSLEAGHHASKLVHAEMSGLAVDWQRDYVDPVTRSTSIFEVFVRGWYDGQLRDAFFSESIPNRTRRRITSILAGYTQRSDNPIANDPQRALDVIYRYREHGSRTARAPRARKPSASKGTSQP